MKKTTRLPTLAASCLMPLTVLHAVEVQNLRCEYLKDPLAIDVAKPRLSWIISNWKREGRKVALEVTIPANTTPYDYWLVEMSFPPPNKTVVNDCCSKIVVKNVIWNAQKKTRQENHPFSLQSVKTQKTPTNTRFYWG